MPVLDPDKVTTYTPALAAAVVEDVENSRGAPGANLTDANATVQVSEGAHRRLPAATLSANRTITLGTTNAKAGDQIEFMRLDLTAFTLAFVNGGAGAGTLLTLPVSKLGCARFQFDGTNWFLRSFGMQP